MGMVEPLFSDTPSKFKAATSQPGVKKQNKKKNIFLGATITVLAAVNVIIALPLDSNEE